MQRILPPFAARPRVSAPCRRPAVAALALALVACGDVSAPSDALDAAAIRVSANLAGTPISTLVITVSAADLATPLLFNLEVAEGVAEGTLRVPPGPDRTFAVEALDATGEVTHEGSRTVEVRRGPNPPLSIPLVPRSGQVPVTITMGDYSVAITPAAVSVVAGETAQLAATVTTPDGDVLDVAVAWATTDPSRVRVDASGLVTAVAPGTATVVATFEGIGGMAEVTVTDGSLLITSISGGEYHSCGLAADGAAYCWGGSFWGQVGTGEASPGLTYFAPVPVAGGLTFIALEAGWDHTCGVATGGAAYCWGVGGSGKLGNGALADAWAPAAVSGGHVFASLGVGQRHTCGVTTAGEAWCWGLGDQGQLGDGALSSASTPVRVAGGLKWRAVASGWVHTCGLTTDGAAYCWGGGSLGRLGDGSGADSAVPRPVGDGRVYDVISAAGFHTCAIERAGTAGSGGAAWCWGGGAGGRLGTGSDADRYTPTAVAGGSLYVTISAGWEHTCALATDGVAHCWGEGGNGELGDGATTSSNVPVPVSAPIPFETLGVGNQHSCAAGAAAYCWGFNGDGKLGDGTGINSLVPVPVAAPSGG